MSKTWLADELFPYLHSFYPEKERLLKSGFFHPKPIYVPFDSIEKQNNWLGASANTKYEGFINGFVGDKYSNSLKNHFGGMELAQSGFVDTRAYLGTAAAHFRERGILINQKISVADLALFDDHVEWEGGKFRKVIFCDGPQNAENPFFNWLDYRRVKGEILLIELEEETFEHIINRGCWVIPVGNKQYKVGSTYDWKDLSTTPTDTGKSKVIEKLEELINKPYQIIDHWAGVRPATYDRRPFIGLHPDKQQIGLFNGMGSKGMSLSPYLAKHFADFLDGKVELMPEVKLDRKKRK